jgi:hypothetical protein
VSWLRRRRNADVPGIVEVAERLAGTGRSGVTAETCELTDSETVRRWLFELSADRDQQLLVHRSWGSLAVAPDRKRAASVILSDGEHSWFAVPPGADDKAELTPEQIEHVVIDALGGSSRPKWPDWRSLT